ncbi:hypothetical protein NOK12_13640 [Nocardioides sp. OK12]|uniref:hypothetical protein n=1 Tax=Nocardioides sp. OK12 TaxID=2758661 RepID=UPI0021C2E398|nr:hypothetical protein [Nocardioides sp. OK12]GHJ58846.1 hypothetical protein NOK12_13640 [Nocardioides sp. OK12]
MSVDTELPGSPRSIESAAAWLEGSLAAAVDQGVERVAAARRVASSDWEGAAGTGFADRMGVAVDKIDHVHRATASVAREMTAYADTLRRQQERMAEIRGTARAAGLTVTAYVVEAPGAAPADPGDAPTGRVSPTAVDAHAAAVEAWADHQAKVLAYERVVAEAAQVRDGLLTATRLLEDEYRGLSGPGMLLTALDIAGGFGAAGVVGHASVLKAEGRRLVREAEEYIDLIRRKPGGFHNGDLNHWDARKLEGGDIVRRAGEIETRAKLTSMKLGGALSVVGIGLDLVAGESPAQAVTSGAGGLGASIAAGALVGAGVGSLVPVPGVGTVAGAVVGAGVGIVTSGAIDALFEEGPDVMNALDEGWESLKDTGGAIGGGVGAVVGGIGGFFD